MRYNWQMLRFIRWLPFIALGILLTACLPGGGRSDNGPTPTPLPTTSAPEFPVVAPRACRLARYDAMRTLQAQGDLLAWDSNGLRLAFVGPAANSEWFSGKINLVSGPDFNSPLTPFPDLLIFGDLKWSPDGSQLAFIDFRQPDAYTVMTSANGTATPIDLFASTDPRTDAYAGSKAIQSWKDDHTLDVLSSCGDDCDQTIEIDLNTRQLTEIGEQLRKSPSRLWPKPNERDYDTTRFPILWLPEWETRLSPQMKRPEWTLDGSKVAYIDFSLTAWVLRVDQKIQYMLETPNVDVQELKWSHNGRYLAIRTDDDVIVYDTECTQ
jgi:hypothetical protein